MHWGILVLERLILVIYGVYKISFNTNFRSLGILARAELIYSSHIHPLKIGLNTLNTKLKIKPKLI